MFTCRNAYLTQGHVTNAAALQQSTLGGAGSGDAAVNAGSANFQDAYQQPAMSTAPIGG